MGMLDDEFLTVAEVAELLKLNQQTVRNWIDQGYLPALHVGRRVRIRRTDLDELLKKSRIQSHQPEPAAAPGFWDGDVPEPQPEPEQLG